MNVNVCAQRRADKQGGDALVLHSIELPRAQELVQTQLPRDHLLATYILRLVLRTGLLLFYSSVVLYLHFYFLFIFLLVFIFIFLLVFLLIFLLVFLLQQFLLVIFLLVFLFIFLLVFQLIFLLIFLQNFILNSTSTVLFFPRPLHFLHFSHLNTCALCFYLFSLIYFFAL